MGASSSAVSPHQIQEMTIGIRRIVAMCKEAKTADTMRDEPSPTPRNKASFSPRDRNQVQPMKRLQPLSMTSGAPLASPANTVSYGQCISAACYLILESILVRTQADRLSLFMIGDTGTLSLVANVGAGTIPVGKDVPVGPSSLVQHVVTTQIAANLARADLEDVSECGGPSAAKNTIVFPVKASPRGPAVGAIQLVNKKKGTQPFDQQDELLLHIIIPSVACILERYPTKIAHFTFDPQPIHVWSPLPTYSQPTIDVVPSLAAAPTQMVYHRGDAGRYARKDWMQNARDVNTSTAAAHLQDIERHLRVMEGCWRGSILENMHSERLLLQKEHHIHDARDIINRKQKKLDQMKNVLCDEVARHLRGESALTKSVGRM
eukprot:GILI01022476.1.p1 GENE.GILI01022476.1~~GILI01022476.1.p1  ORF type:complete len:422 (-),score=50.38 GILI01022476.1:31-1161(-)